MAECVVGLLPQYLCNGLGCPVGQYRQNWGVGLNMEIFTLATRLDLFCPSGRIQASRYNWSRFQSLAGRCSLIKLATGFLERQSDTVEME